MDKLPGIRKERTGLLPSLRSAQGTDALGSKETYSCPRRSHADPLLYWRPSFFSQLAAVFMVSLAHPHRPRPQR